MCQENLIGIRGACKDAKLYIDDLPGINVENAADIAEGFKRPLDVVREAFSLAIDQVFVDWTNEISTQFDFVDVHGRVNYKNAGKDYQYTGGGVVKITLERVKDLFLMTHLKSIGFYSLTTGTKTFYVKNTFGDIVKEVSKEIKVGYNKIEFDIQSDSELVSVEFNTDGLEIGAFDKPFTREWQKNAHCGYCLNSCGCLAVYLDKPIGLDIEANCVSDKCALINEFINSLKMPLLYKTGINFFLEVKGTTRINAYTRNSKEQVDYFLNLWQGGTDMVTGIKTPSSYWMALKTAAKGTIYTLKSTNLKPFKYNATEIVNNLP